MEPKERVRFTIFFLMWFEAGLVAILILVGIVGEYSIVYYKAESLSIRMTIAMAVIIPADVLPMLSIVYLAYCDTDDGGGWDKGGQFPRESSPPPPTSFSLEGSLSRRKPAITGLRRVKV